MALEHNGDLYSCDHYVYAKNLLGNILQQPMTELAISLSSAGSATTSSISFRITVCSAMCASPAMANAPKTVSCVRRRENRG